MAQPEPCGVDEMTSTCLDACVVCDIDGFTGRNNLTIQGQTFSGFCTTIFHNMSYIAFVAGTTDLTLTVSVTNCTTNNGLEIGIFESLDCSTFTPVAACNTDVPANGVATFSNTTPLVIGQHYYLIMDGSRGDICDWTFSVIEGSTLVGELTTSGAISGPQETCPNLQHTFSVAPEVGATFFEWTLNGQPQNSSSTEIDLAFPADGSYQLCVTASNVCDEAPQSCTTILVESATSVLQETICANEFFEVAGELVCESGVHQFSIPLTGGCDSTVFLALTVLPELASVIDINLCLGESFSIGNVAYSATGNYVEVIPSLIGCDSTVTLNMTVIDCELIAAIDHTNPVCSGDENGVIEILLQNGIPPFTYEWEELSNASLAGVGTVNSLSDIVIDNLPAGVYEINITDSFGDDIVFIYEVIDPPLLVVDVTAVDYNDFNLTCYGSADGEATAVAFGGVQPYSFLWDNGVGSETISNVAGGIYEVEITDAAGCVDTASVWLTEPDSISLITNFVDPNCFGPSTGAVFIELLTGGTLPYSYLLNGDAYNPLDTSQSLSSGNYDFTLVDANGCSVTNSGTLQAPDIPLLFVNSEEEVDLGYQVLLSAQTNNSNLIDVTWVDDSQSLECDSCLTTYASPVNDTEYILTVTSVDNCTASASIFVSVIKDKIVYAPTAFSPNGDGVNDDFFLFSDRSVLGVKAFSVFNRWGDLMFQKKGIVTNESSFGWGGSFNGKEMDSDVFVWVAEVEYLDGEISILTGDISLIK